MVISLNEKEVQRKTVTVSPNSTAIAEFTGFELPLGFSQGRVRVDAEDPLMVDNDFLFSIERREKLERPHRRCRQTSAEPLSAPGLHLDAGAAVRSNDHTVSSVTAEEIAKHDVVVINDVPRLPDSVRNKMDEVRKSGKGATGHPRRELRTQLVEQLCQAAGKADTAHLCSERSRPALGIPDHIRSESQHLQAVSDQHAGRFEFRAVFCVREHGSEGGSDRAGQVRGRRAGDYRIRQGRSWSHRFQYRLSTTDGTICL